MDTALEFDPKNLGSHGGLVSIALGESETRHVAMLDDVPQAKKVEFDAWWNAPVFVDSHRQTLTRKDLVLTAANQDGGAHVNPNWMRCTQSWRATIRWHVTLERRACSSQWKALNGLPFGKSGTNS